MIRRTPSTPAPQGPACPACGKPTTTAELLTYRTCEECYATVAAQAYARPTARDPARVLYNPDGRKLPGPRGEE